MSYESSFIWLYGLHEWRTSVTCIAVVFTDTCSQFSICLILAPVACDIIFRCWCYLTNIFSATYLLRLLGKVVLWHGIRVLGFKRSWDILLQSNMWLFSLPLFFLSKPIIFSAAGLLTRPEGHYEGGSVKWLSDRISSESFQVKWSLKSAFNLPQTSIYLIGNKNSCMTDTIWLMLFSSLSDSQLQDKLV